MQEPLEMVTASLMQNMVQIFEESTYFVTKVILKQFEKTQTDAIRKQFV